jgi:hypothetical protein
MKTKTKFIGLAMAALAAASVAAFLIWLFTLEGMKGLSAWGWAKIFTAIGVAGALPLLLYLAATLARGLRAEGSKAGAALSGISLALAAAAILAVAGLTAYLWSKGHAFSGNVPALNLVDPAKGIVPADQGTGPGGKVVAGGPTLRLALSSDPHWGASTSDPGARTAILKAVAAETPRRDALFILGDNTQLGMNEGEWRAEAEDLSANLGGAAGLAVRPVLGNHDALFGGQEHFVQYYFPKGFSTDSGSPYWYSMDAGPAVIVVLDLLWGAEEFSPAKRAWLEKTLASVPADKRIIVLTHCFFAASGYVDGGYPWFDHYGTLAEVSPILEKYKVDLVVSGHNHYMELLERNGVTYALVGAMGGKLDPVPTHVSPWSKWLGQGHFGWLDLDVTKAGIALGFRDYRGEVLETADLPATR